MDLIKTIEESQKRPGAQDFNVGDTVKVYFKIIEGKTERIQIFEGIVLCKKNEGARRTFTVRKISYGVGVEKTFLIHSPAVEKVEVIRVGKARRAKLFYLRDRLGKAAKTKEKVGARIETKELTIKEELVEEPAEEVKEEAIPEEALEAVKEEKVQEPKAEESKTEEPKAEEPKAE